MSRKILNPITSSQLNRTYKLDRNKTDSCDKENIVPKIIEEQISKGAIPKKLSKEKKDLNQLHSNIPSSLSFLSPSRSKDNAWDNYNSGNTYPITKFPVFSDNSKATLAINNETNKKIIKDKSSFKKSKEFFHDIEKIQHKYELGSPIATKIVKNPFADSFHKARETFIIQEEATKIREQIESLMLRKSLSNKNIVPGKFDRVSELKTEDSNLTYSLTPYDDNNIPPPRATIKIIHKHTNISNIKHQDTKLISPSLEDIFTILYSEDIMHFYVNKEKLRTVFNPNFRSSNVNPSQRKILMYHLIRIIKDHHYPSFLAYQAARLFHDMLDIGAISIQNLQLFEITSLWIIMKNLLLTHAIPHTSKIISFSDQAYTKKDIIQCEYKILQVLKFNISYSDPFSVFYYCLFAHKNIIMLPQYLDTIYYSGSYMLDIILFDEELMNASAILLGCAVAELALIINLSPEDAFTPVPYNGWRSNLAQTNFTGEQIIRVQSLILRLIAQSSYRHNPEHIVFKKYKRSRYGRLSHILIALVLQFVS